MPHTPAPAPPPPGARTNVLITGASAGIGEALAHRFARAGCNLVLVARSEDKLLELSKTLARQHGVRTWVAAADLAQPGAVQRLAARMQRARRRIDVLVNNAGVLAHAPFVDQAAQQHRALIDLNITALSDMLAAFLPPMVARGQGRVLNVASIAAFQPVPMLATYAATKAYVLSLTESLSEELAGSGVTVTALCPGITATSMLDKARQARSELDRLPAFVVGDVDAVADAGFDACMQGTVICVPGALNRAAAMAGRAAPRWAVRRIGGAVARNLTPSRG